MGVTVNNNSMLGWKSASTASTQPPHTVQVFWGTLAFSLHYIALAIVAHVSSCMILLTSLSMFVDSTVPHSLRRIDNLPGSTVPV